MSIRNFDALFDPKSVVIVTAGDTPRELQAVLQRNCAKPDSPALL